MRVTLRLLLLAPTALLATLLYPSPKAHAGIDACGDIDIDASADCEWVPPSVDCDVRCTPITVQAACAADLYVDCDGTCTADPVIECTDVCRVDCEADCDVDPGRFECRGACQADCDGSCSAACDDDDDECHASCQATCSARCDARCEVVPPSADCTVQCDACCTGFCEADANIDCQIDCQADLFVDCQADVEGSCHSDCDGDDGALFCDGQFVDHGDNLDECVDALKDAFDIDVAGYIHGDCRGNHCEVHAGGGVSCGVGGSGGSGALAGWVLAGAAMLGVGRRRARARRGTRP
jgi:hypothetical protein